MRRCKASLCTRVRGIRQYNTCMIGVFDSGFGGLTLLRDMVRVLPQYDYLYLGDTARAPYGTRSPEIVRAFTKEAVDFLYREGCQLVILACNTASSEALREMQQNYVPRTYPNRRILGVLVPAAQDAVAKTKNNRIGVIATEGTVLSRAYERELKKLNPDVEVFQRACPLLVPLIEAGEDNPVLTSLLLQRYLTPLLERDIDTLILGCTHYGIIEQAVQNMVGTNVAVIGSGTAVAPKLANYLARHPELEKDITQGGTSTFCTTDLTEKFARLGSRFYGDEFVPRIVSLGSA